MKSVRFLFANLLAVLMVCALAFGLQQVAIHYGPLAAVAAFGVVMTLPLALVPQGSVFGAAATTAINTPTRTGDLLYLPVAAAAKIFMGTLVARDSAGRAVPASNTNGLRVVGRAEETVDNSAGSAGDLSINIRLGCFKFANSAGDAVDPDDVGKLAVVEDDNTVAETASNMVAAGRVIALESDGVWVDTRFAYFGPRKVITIASVQEATANGSDAATTQALANALKAKYNTLQAEVAALASSLFG